VTRAAVSVRQNHMFIPRRKLQRWSPLSTDALLQAIGGRRLSPALDSKRGSCSRQMYGCVRRRSPRRALESSANRGPPRMRVAGNSSVAGMRGGDHHDSEESQYLRRHQPPAHVAGKVHCQAACRLVAALINTAPEGPESRPWTVVDGSTVRHSCTASTSCAQALLGSQSRGTLVRVRRTNAAAL